MRTFSFIKQRWTLGALIALVFIFGFATRSIISAGLAEAYTHSTLPSLDYNLTPNAVSTWPSNATTTTFSVHVGQGNDQMLIIPMGAGNGGEDTSATYNGTAMTYGSCHGWGTEEYYGFWYMLSPTQGTHDVVINFPSSNGRQYAAFVLDNVDQTTPFDACAHVGGNGGNPSLDVHTSQSNDLVLYWLDYDDRSTNLVYTPNDDVLYWVNNDPSTNTYGNQGALHLQASSATTTVGGTASGSGPWDLIAVPIRAANP